MMQNDLISRSALLKRQQRYTEFDEAGFSMTVKAVDVEEIQKAPAVDAVEVVRCRDCKWLYDGMDMYCCTKHTGLALIKPDGSGFCSYGERGGITMCDEVSTAAWIVCPWCDEKKCVGRYNCKQIADWIKEKQERRSNDGR